MWITRWCAAQVILEHVQDLKRLFHIFRIMKDLCLFGVILYYRQIMKSQKLRIMSLVYRKTLHAVGNMKMASLKRKEVRNLALLVTSFLKINLI